jgi:hypothetical protein
VNDVVVILVGSIERENVAVTVVVSGTKVAPATGERVVTVGAVRPDRTVKDHVYAVANVAPSVAVIDGSRRAV